MNRRQFLASASAAMAQTSEAPTKFQLACMTLPYSSFPLERALTGIRQAGYDFVAWGVNHTDASGTRRPALAVDALPAEAATLAQRCRGMGLEPVMMFSTVHLEGDEALDPHLRRIDQAAAAKIPFLLTFGKTEPGQYETVIRNLQKMGPRA